MERKHIVCAILVFAAVVTLSAIAVEATEWDHAQWLYDVGRHKIWQTNSILVNEIGPEVQAIEAKLDDTVIPNLGTFPTVNKLYSSVSDGLDKVGMLLSDTFAYVDDVRNKLGTHGDDYEVPTPTVFAYLGEILEELNDPNHGLAEIKTEVANIELKLDPGGSFYTFVENWFLALETKLDDIWFLTGNAHGWPNLPSALDAIRYGIADIRNVLGNPWDTTYGWPTFTAALEDIKFEITVLDDKCAAILVELNQIEWKLDNIVIPEIQAIEAKLDNIVIPEIQAIEAKLDNIVIPEIQAIEAKLDNIVIPEIQAIEAKLDNIVIPLFGQGLVGEGVRDETEIGMLVGDTAVVGEWTHDVGIEHPKKYSLQLQIEQMEAGDQFEVKLQMWYGYGDVYRNDGTLWQMMVDHTMDGAREIVFVNQLAIDTPVRVLVTRTSSSAVPDSEFIEWLMIIEEV